MQIIVLGAGSWGTALARLLCENGHQVVLQSWMPEQIAAMEADGENRAFLPGAKLPPELRLTTAGRISRFLFVCSRGAQAVVSGRPSALAR